MTSDALGFVETNFEFEHPPCGEGVLWSICGGESAGLKIDNTLSISGLDETMLYLEKTELEIFKDFSFIEFRTCKEGFPVTTAVRAAPRTATHLPRMS